MNTGSCATGLFGDYDQPEGSRSNDVGGVAGNQGEFAVLCDPEDAKVCGCDDFSAHHHVTKFLAVPQNVNAVAIPQLMNVAEERITMASDHRISDHTRNSRTGHVCWAFEQGVRRRAFEHDSAKTNAWDSYFRKRANRSWRGALCFPLAEKFPLFGIDPGIAAGYVRAKNATSGKKQY